MDMRNIQQIQVTGYTRAGGRKVCKRRFSISVKIYFLYNKNENKRSEPSMTKCQTLLNSITVDTQDIFHYSRIFFACLKYSLQKIIFPYEKPLSHFECTQMTYIMTFKILSVSFYLLLVPTQEEKCDFCITDHQNEISSP